MNRTVSFAMYGATLCVFMTGAAAMGYQVVWQRYLARLLGGDAAATAIVLAAFLGGLSLGYEAFGRLSGRIRNPWRAYAIAEIFIGLWGLAFPVLFTLVQSASSSLSLASPWLLALQGFMLAVVLIGPPTLCMGATVPLLTQALSRDVQSSGRTHALLYGINTAGAFLGALFAGYLTVPMYGLSGTLKLCAAFNLFAAFWFICTRPPLPSAPVRTVDRPPAQGLTPGRIGTATLMVVALMNGFQTMALENVLIRFVTLSMGGSAYSFTMVVGLFVLAIAAGALFVARKKAVHSIRALWINQMLIAGSLLAIYPTLDTWPYWAHRLRLLFQPDLGGFWGFQAAGFLALTLVIAFPAACIGAAVPLIFGCLRRDLNTVGTVSGRILRINTLGNLAGSIAAGLLLHPLLNNGQIFLLCVVLAFCGAWLLARECTIPFRMVSGCGVVTATILALTLPFYEPQRFIVGTFRLKNPTFFSYAPPEAFYEEVFRDTHTLFFEDGPEGTAAVIRTPNLPWSQEAPLAIMVNGKSDSSTVSDMATLKLLAHLPALLAKQRSQTLVIGLGTGVTSAELALYPDVDRIDTAEISSSVIKALPYFSAFTGEVHANDRFNLIHADAFRTLSRSTTTWDLIISEPSNPWVLGVDALFSRELYRLAKQHLNEGGLFVQWIHIQDASDQMLGTVFTTLGSEFPHIRVFMSQINDLILVASLDPLPDAVLEKAGQTYLANRAVADSLAETGITSLEALLAREIARPSFQGSLETLDRPVLHYTAGKSYFMADTVSYEVLLGGEKIATNRETMLLARYERIRSQGPLTPIERQTLIETAVDRRGEEEIPLPLARILEKRFFDPEGQP